MIGVDYLGYGPNSPNGPALPAGAPSGLGVVVAEYLELRSRATAPIVIAPSPLRANRVRLHSLLIKEQAGVWRLDGNQQSVEVGAKLKISPAAIATAQNQGLDVGLEITVKDNFNQHGGIASVSCTGPQLLSVNASGQSDSPAVGTKPLNSGSGKWTLSVKLAAAGTSTLPLVENVTGPRDSYSIMVTWNDNTTSGPYVAPLRCAIDLSASPALALAAIPGNAPPATTALLNQAGLPTTTCTVNFTDGTFPPGASLGDLGLRVQGTNSTTSVDQIIPILGLAQSFTITTPYLSTGTASIQVTRRDVYLTEFFKLTSVTL